MKSLAGVTSEVLQRPALKTSTANVALTSPFQDNIACRQLGPID